MNAINPMESDEKSIEWLNQIINEGESDNEYSELKEAWLILNDYYNDCITELKNLPTTESPYLENGQLNGNILYRKYNDFKNICEKEFIVDNFLKEFEGIYTRDDINKLINTKKKTEKLTLEEQWLITKLIRFNNMQLKLAHSARITYIAKYNLDKLIGDTSKMDKVQVENIKLLRSSVILSALLHDIGRFYQAVHYSSFNDREMEKFEKRLEVPKVGGDKGIDILSVDHAVAGYYYALSSALKFQKSAQDTNEDSVRKFIIQAISAVVVRFHQKNNKELENFESDESIGSLRNESLKTDIHIFLCAAYDIAKIKNEFVDNRLLKSHKVFIDKFIEKIGIKDSAYEGFKQSPIITETIDNLKCRINVALSEFNPENIDEVSNNIMNIMNEEIEKLGQSNKNLNTSTVTKDEIIKLLDSIIDYDIAESIMYCINYRLCLDKVKYYISTSLLTTMDADKIDIINQRAKGTYPGSYNPSTYEIFPSPYEINGKEPTLKNLLEEYYCYDFNVYTDSGIDINKTKKTISKVSRVLYGFKSKIKNIIFNDIQKNFPLELCEKLNNIYNKEISEDEIEIENNFIRIHNKTSNNYVDFAFSELKEIFDFIFNKNWYEYIYEKCAEENMDFKEFKQKHFYDAQISVKALDLTDNLGISFKQNGPVLKKIDGSLLNEEEQEKVLRIYKRLVMSSELADRFKLHSDNEKNPDWIKNLDEEESAHLVGSSFSGLIWQLNQFILVNMRNINSYKFIIDNGILDEIIPTYQKENGGIMALMLKDYIEYTKYFVMRIIKLYDEGLTKDLINKYDIKKTLQDKFDTTLVSKDVLELVRRIVNDEYEVDFTLKSDISKKI